VCSPSLEQVEDAARELKPDATVIYVPPPFAADAIIDAIKAEIPLVVAITEGVPQHDMVKVRYPAELAKSNSWQIARPATHAVFLLMVVRLNRSSGT